MIKGNSEQISISACKKYLPTIIIGIILFELMLWVGGIYIPEHIYLLVSSTAMIFGAFISAYSYTLYKRYHSSQSTSSSFFILMISFIGYAVAEFLWSILDYHNMESYPSIADASYMVYFVFAIIFVIITLTHYSCKLTKFDIMLVLLICFTSILFYATLSIEYNHPITIIDALDFYYGGMFVVLASILMSVSILTAYKLKNDLKILWIIIALVMIINSGTDISYYTIENTVGYEYGAPLLDTAYFTADIILLFALYLHRKLI